MRTLNIFLPLLLAWVAILGCTRPESSGPSGAAGPTALSTQPPSSTSSTEKAIQIKGSDTMVNLGQAWAEAFLKKTGIQVAVTGGGSGTGIAALLNGTCDIAESSRKMEPEELAEAQKKGITPKEIMVGLDGLAVVVHPSNPVSRLTIDQLADIFTGRITNWKEVGGEDASILVLSREVNSGTHVYFKERVLRRGDKNRTEEFSSSALLQPSSQAIADEVAQNPRAIGYYGMGYISARQKAIAVGETAEGPFLEPTCENVINGSYSISRPLLFYTNGEPQGIVKQYIDFVLSDEGQKIVEEQEFVPISKE
ncbi:MAG: phosphate ABC transporter substrate-binding protein [Candidatus Zipacnadales bacterium]